MQIVLRNYQQDGNLERRFRKQYKLQRHFAKYCQFSNKNLENVPALSKNEISYSYNLKKFRRNKSKIIISINCVLIFI